MDNLIELDGAALAAAIFVLRILNYSVGTMRLVMIGRGYRLYASMMAVLEAFIFAVVIAGVVQNLDNHLNLAAYCLGAAVGSWVGMELESRLVKSFVIVNVFLQESGHALAQRLRDEGYGVTEIVGEGRDGLVTTLRSVVNKRQTRRLTELVSETAPDAFIAVEEARNIRHGWLGTGRGKTL